MLSPSGLSTTGPYDEALDRLHDTGPEFDDYLSNHGPMVAEALARLGRSEGIHGWTDAYLGRLDEPPRGIVPIGHDGWSDALGDPTRAGDWIGYFLPRVDDQPWDELMTTWWPRLLPGIAAGATHGVIRVGHAVRALRAADSRPRRRELAHALAYWATRWQSVPVVTPSGTRDVAVAIGVVPQVADQRLGIGHRLAQLDATAGWRNAMGALAGPPRVEEVPTGLAALVEGVLGHYAGHAHGSPTMLVHAATAPMAVLNILPSLPRTLWSPSFDAAWTATGAVLAAYTPASPRPSRTPSSADDVLDQALHHGGEHVIKLADTAMRTHGITGRADALSAVLAAVELDA